MQKLGEKNTWVPTQFSPLSVNLHERHKTGPGEKRKG